MSTLSSAVLNLADIAKMLDPNGSVARIIEMLTQRNEILTDMQWKEGNLPTGNRTTIRTGLPAVYWRLLNQGVAPSKSTTQQVDESCGILEGWNEVDVELAKLNGNTAGYRLSEARAKLQAMNNEMAQTLFYGNSGLNPEEFNGLSVRYSDLTAQNVRNMINGNAASGQTDCTSIWLVVWGEDTCHGIFPKGSQAGLEHEDLGLQTVETAAGASGTVSGNRLRVYQDRFVWRAGITVKDWRFVARAHSIDVSSDNADYIDLMTKMTWKVEDLGAGKPAFYMNRTVGQRLDLLRRADITAGGGLTYDNVDGKVVRSFRGIPIRITDAILDSEDSLN